MGEPLLAPLAKLGASMKRPRDDLSSNGLERFNGTISAWTPGGKFGFIKCAETFALYGKDCWVHSQQMGSFVSGDEVSFTLMLNKDGHPQAIDLVPSGVQRFKGKISSWTPGGKFGFIQCSETYAIYGKDCWVHSQQIGNLESGDVVSFTLILNKAGA